MAFYEIKINNPKNDNEKRINGFIKTIEYDNRIKAIGYLEGMPNPFTNNGVKIEKSKVGPIQTDYLDETVITILNQLISLLEVEVYDIYGININDRLIFNETKEEVSQDFFTSTQPDIFSATYSTDDIPTQEIYTEEDDEEILKNASATIFIKKGPGEIIGDNEVIIENGVFDFSNIQFTDSGSYVLHVIPSTDKIEETEFEIYVSEEDPIIEQEEKNFQNNLPEDPERPIVSQVFPPSVNLEPIKYKIPTNVEDTQNIYSEIGFHVFLWYNGVKIDSKDISRLELYSEGIVPSCDVVFNDTFGLITSEETTPITDTKFEVFINSGSKLLKSIHLKFKITENKVKKNGAIKFKGKLDIPNFYKTRFKSYSGTSYSVLKEISKEHNLGFNSNISNTNDYMVWRQTGSFIKDFIQKITNHSYKDDNSFFRVYIDYYYRLNFIEIEKEYNRDISNDVGVLSQGLSSQRVTNNNEEKLVPLRLTNDASSSSNEFFFGHWKQINQSTYLNISKGIYTKSKVYDRVNQQFLKFDVDSLTKEKGDTYILKGDIKSDDDYNENYSNVFGGVSDFDNVHKNYEYSIVQNRRNLNNLYNIVLDVDLPQPNYNLYKYQKVFMEFINQKRTISDRKIMDNRYTGGYIITNNRYKFKDGSLTQKLTIVRKELGKTYQEISTHKTIEKNDGNSERNENPIENPDPNSNYRIGDIYKVENEKQEEYELIIIDVLSDGITVIGDLKRLSTENNVSGSSQIELDSTDKQELYSDVESMVEGDNGEDNKNYEFTSNEIKNDSTKKYKNKEFNTKKDNYFINDRFGELEIIQKKNTKGFIFSGEGDNSNLLDSEYIEREFVGEDEVIIEDDGYANVDVEKLNEVKGEVEEPDNYTTSYNIPSNWYENMEKVLSALNNKNITNKFVQAAILAVVSKESEFKPKDEVSYKNTDSTRIKNIFRKMKKYSLSQIDKLKKDDKKFFDVVYGPDIQPYYGNGPNEGYKYRGRGFNQLTFKGNYEMMNRYVNITNIVKYPDSVNNPSIAAEVLAGYYVSRWRTIQDKHKNYYNTSDDINDFSSLEDAVGAIYHANAGWGHSFSKLEKDPTGGKKKTLHRAPAFFNWIQENV